MASDTVASALVPCVRARWDDQEGTTGVAAYLAGGEEHGVEITSGADGEPVTRAMCMNLEHYLAISPRGGLFVPRYRAPRATATPIDDTIAISIRPFDPWQIHTTVSLRALSGHLIEARYEFRFEAVFDEFEAFVSNYLYGANPPWLHLAGHWQQVKLTGKEHRFWARDGASATRIQAPVARRGCPENIRPNGGLESLRLPDHYHSDRQQRMERRQHGRSR